MRTTLSLDDDVFAVARQRAQRERISLGEAVSRYVRDALRANAQAPATPVPLRSKYSVLPARDEIITNEHVRRLMEQEGI
ncbi:MAG: hypothetical protein IPG23_11295 [Burkholderiales bacterium]|nr:hypothetical protein [Burkholderiales bacterium]